jgi:hypothetical protein
MSYKTATPAIAAMAERQSRTVIAIVSIYSFCLTLAKVQRLFGLTKQIVENVVLINGTLVTTTWTTGNNYCIATLDNLDNREQLLHCHTLKEHKDTKAVIGMGKL